MEGRCESASVGYRWLYLTIVKESDMSPLEKMRMDALKLSAKERAFLAKCLIDSLDQTEEQEIEQMWLDEAERRLAAYGKGTIPARSASEVFAEAYERIR
jgi:putative addiction module component (TIGR02574 family)